jgi:hypothetical protein
MHLGNWGKNETRFGASFFAQMNDFCSSENPLVTDLNFGLEVLTHRTEKKTSKTELKEWIDQAVLWGAVNPGDLNLLNEELAYLLKIKEVSYTLQIKIGNLAFLKLLSALAEGNLKLWAQVLAAAMPYNEVFDVRNNLFLRRSTYAELWFLYLSNPTFNPGFWASTAENKLLSIDKNLSLWEGQVNSANTPNPDSFSSLVSSFGIDKKIHQLSAGFSLLNDKFLAGLPVNLTLNEAFKKMDDFWTKPFLIRAFGRYLVEMANILKVDQDLETIFTITYKDHENEKILNISQSIN